MKRLLLILFASALFLSVSAQKVPAKPKADSLQTKLPIGLYVLPFNREEVMDLLSALQLSDYSRKKTDNLIGKINQLAMMQEQNWAEQADTTKNKKK